MLAAEGKELERGSWGAQELGLTVNTPETESFFLFALTACVLFFCVVGWLLC